MGIAAELVQSFTEPLDNFMSNGVTNLAAAMKGPLYAATGLYVALFGILIVLGMVQRPLQDFVVNILKICVIVVLVTNAGEYNTVVKDLFFTQLPDGIGTAIGTSASRGVTPEGVATGSAFDAVVTQVLSIGKTISESGTWRNLYPIIVGSLFTLVMMIPTLLLLAVVIYAKVGLALLISLGPIFIALLLFRATASWTYSWLSGLVNFVALQVLAIAVITILLGTVDHYLQQASGQSPAVQMVMAWRMVGIAALTCYLAFQLPQISAALSSGGVAIGSGLFSAAANGWRRFANPARSGGPAAAGGTIKRG